MSCTKQNDSGIFNPRIETGVAKVSGNVINLCENNEFKVFNLKFESVDVILNKIDEFKVAINDDGSFECEIPVTISPQIVSVLVNNGITFFTISITPEQETKLEIICPEEAPIEVKIISGSESFFESPEEAKQVSELFSKMAMLGSDKSRTTKDTINLFVQNPNEYIPYFIRNNLNYRLEIMKEDTILSDKTKAYYLDLFSLFMFKLTFFELSFDEGIIKIYEDIKPEGDTTTLKITNQPDKTYYSFLKDLNLNNSQYLYNMHYSSLCQEILTNKILNLSPINETPIDEWLKGVKSIMADLVGFDKGQFYDILIANAYSKQFSDELKPLSEKQIQNIKTYYKGGDIEKIILHENEKIVKIANDKGEAIVNETPQVANEKLLDAILSNYKGKAVVVDLWATWCAPCLSAMKKIQPLKAESKDKDVVFVYITNTSSPKELWEAKIKAIDGEHYYLNEEQWTHIMNSLKITAIPAYLFYNKTGKLSFDPVIGYPGEDWMRSLIKNALSE
jgi:thiol-disulfide isomerase/thioredoxin